MLNTIKAKRILFSRGGLGTPAAGSEESARRIVRSHQRSEGLPGGFTLMEVLVVVAFIAILLMMAVPALTSLTPPYMVRSSANSLATMMQKARLMANNTQKPIRVAVDCRSASQRNDSTSCLLTMSSANFTTAGELDVTAGAWAEVSQTRRGISNVVTVSLATDSPMPQAAFSPVIGNVYWAVFLPTGRVHASHDPMRLIFSATNLNGVAPRELSLNRHTGRVVVRNR